MIRVRHLQHRYGSQVVLEDVSFDVAEGEIFGFIGANGAGKTTTIRVLATLLEPTAGRVEIDGIDVVLEPERVRRILGYMPDHAGLYEATTVREYLDFFAAAFFVDGSVVDGVLELTDIASLQAREVSSLSKGQKQRLQLARILLHDPKVLVLDEPASDLDPRARVELRDLLQELSRLGKTIFLSSHILSELAELCTSVAFLSNGKITAVGPVAALTRSLGNAVGQGLRRVRVHVLAEEELVRDALLGMETTIDPIANDDGFVAWVTHQGGAKEGAELVRLLVRAGIPVVSVEPDRSELERAFLRSTEVQGGAS